MFEDDSENLEKMEFQTVQKLNFAARINKKLPRFIYCIRFPAFGHFLSGTLNERGTNIPG
jgi:hypothetical protein